jgi:putative transcriptional regulator
MGQQLAKRLAKRLRTLRGDLPQLRFSKKIGISNASLNRIEIGRQNVTLEMLETLCARLKCDVGDLFSEPDDSGPRQ